MAPHAWPGSLSLPDGAVPLLAVGSTHRFLRSAPLLVFPEPLFQGLCIAFTPPRSQSRLHAHRSSLAAACSQGEEPLVTSRLLRSRTLSWAPPPKPLHTHSWLLASSAFPPAQTPLAPPQTSVPAFISWVCRGVQQPVREYSLHLRSW